MIYLIGGPPKYGKTTLAKRLSKESGISYLGTDMLGNIVSQYIPDDDKPGIFPHRNVRGDSNDIYYRENSAQQIVERYIQQGTSTDMALITIAQVCIIESDDIIIEGYGVTPEIVASIFEKFGHQNVRAAFLIKEDEEKFVENIHKTTTPNDWILRKTKEEVTFSRIAHMIKVYSEYFEKESEKYGMPVFPMDENFEMRQNKVMEYLTC